MLAEEGGENGEGEEEEEEVEGDDTNTLAYAEDLIEKGMKLSKAGDNAATVDWLSRAVEIWLGLLPSISSHCCFFKTREKKKN